MSTTKKQTKATKPAEPKAETKKAAPAAEKKAAPAPVAEKKAAPAPAAAKKVVKRVNPNAKKHQPIRLYARGVFVGFRRNLGNQRPQHALLNVEGVRTKEDAQFYLGKRVAFIYKAKRLIDGRRFRVIWGRIQRVHGNSGVVRAHFRTNLPSRAMGAQVRVMLYPSRV